MARSVGKVRVLHSRSTLPWLHKNGLWAWEHFLTKTSSPHSLCWTCHLCGTIFPCFRLNVCSFALLLKYVHPMAPGQPHCYVCPLQGRDGVLLLHHKRDVSRPIVLCWLQGGDLLAMGNHRALLELILLCLFSM